MHSKIPLETLSLNSHTHTPAADNGTWSEMQKTWSYHILMIAQNGVDPLKTKLKEDLI